MVSIQILDSDDSDWLSNARSLLKELSSSSSSAKLPAEFVLSKLDTTDLDVIDTCLNLCHVSDPCMAVDSTLIPSSIYSDSELDLKKSLIKLMLIPSDEKGLNEIALSFISEETDLTKIKIVIKYLWHFIDHNALLKSLRQLKEDKAIFILFNVWKKIDASPLYETQWYWEALCEGLVASNDSGTVKRALYLLKISEKDSLPLTNGSVWNDYFDLIETLDEKQVHIVTPSLGKLGRLHNAFEEDLKWYFAIYRRLFRHQNLALVDWSLNRFLTKNYSFDDVGQAFLLKDLLPVLNTSKLFHNDRKTRDSLLFFFEKCSTPLDTIIQEIISITNWAPIPLFFTVYSIQKSIHKRSEYTLSMNTLHHISEFCSDNLTCMYPSLQISIKTLLLRIVLDSHCEFSDIFSATRGFLKHFFKMNILHSKPIMESVKRWVKPLPLGNEDDVATEWERVLFALIQDKPEEYMTKTSLIPLMETINRPYALTTNDLETYVLFLRYNSSMNKEYIQDFCVLIRRRLDKMTCAMSLSKELDTCIGAFQNCLDSRSQTQFIELLYKNYSENGNVKKYILITFIAAFAGNISIISYSIQKWMEAKFPDVLHNKKESIESGRLWGALECNYLKCQWIVVKRYGIQLAGLDIIDHALKSLDIGGKEVCRPIAEYFTCILDKTENTEDIIRRIYDELLSTLKESVFYYQKSSAFKSLLDSYIALCFHPKVIFSLPSETAECASTLLRDSEVVSVIAESLSLHLSQHSKDIPFEWSAFIAEMLTYGPIFRKDLALSEEVCKLALDYIEVSETPSSAGSIRSIGFKLAFQLKNKSKLVDILWNELLGGDVQSRKRRHFENSFTHLTRNRAAQGLLVLMNELDQNDTNVFFHAFIQEILNADKSRQQQPSVRYLMEWMLSRILLLNPGRRDFFEEFLRAYHTAKQSRLTVIPSFLIIFTQIAIHMPDRREAMLELICPWLMGQHFTTRICAQIGFRRIKNKSEKWNVLSSCLEEVLSQGDEEKNREKLQRDFYQNSFNAQIHWNLTDILYEFPRLCGILQQDWLKESFDFFTGSISRENTCSNWSFHIHGDEQFCYCSDCSPGIDRTKHEVMVTEDSSVHVDTQKKIVVPLEDEEATEGKTKAHPNLILVASLIDRLPNLGGLCRTSEIFGIGSLVMNCLKSLEEKEFQNLSVSSQSWVNTLEVRRETLPHWLRAMKVEEGYHLLGVEQTAQSSNLYDFSFREKSILVLGNEKEGICPEVLRELDSTIEIPQFGMIRSFNVHVTGALVLSEYVRQKIKIK